jgi:hypothetical protein
MVLGAGTLALCFALGCSEESDGGSRDSGAHGDAQPQDASADGRTSEPDGDAGGTSDAEVSPSEPKAFPSAQGFGADTPGGRGGEVHVVTTLDWSGDGSLSEALFSTGPRIIVFRVSGVIDVPGGAGMLGEEHSYVTVAGQTSPGGITLRAAGTALASYQENFHDGVFRHLRFRGDGNYDNVAFNQTHHVIFDHCDFSGATDETLDITFSHDFTVQWSTVTNSDPDGQNYGILFAYPPTANVSFHHNLSAHHGGRCAPHSHWGDEAPDATYDIRNNVFYNCGHSRVMNLTAGGQGQVRLNLKGNYAKAGPSTPMGSDTFFTNLGSSFHLYARQNTYEPDFPVFPSAYHDPTLVDEPHDTPSVDTTTAEQAYEQVLNRAGAWPRDPMNERTVGEVRNGTGELGQLSDSLITSGPEPPADEDRDGMADAWEREQGLDPSDPSDASGDLDDDGYTNVEEYINMLARDRVPGGA